MSILVQRIEGGIEPQIVESQGLEVTVEYAVEAMPESASRSTARKFTFCRFNSSKDNQPKQGSLTWHEFAEEFRRHPERKNKDGTAWSPVSFIRGSTRKKENVEHIYMAVLDVDDGTPYETLLERFSGFSYLAHSSFSHKSEHHKYRVIVPLAEPVHASEWDSVWARFNQFAGGKNDASVKDASRLYFMPGHPAGTDDHFVKENQGRLLTLDDLPELSIPIKNTLVSSSSDSVDFKLQHKLEGDWTNNSELGFEEGLTEVIHRCQFMQFASAPENQQHVSEPLWLAMISNACRFENGEDWIHEASSHHPEYDEIATDKKISHAMKGSAPITCQRIRELGFQHCPNGGCRRPNGLVTRAPAGLSGWMFKKQLTTEQASSDQIPEEYNVNGEFNIRPEGVFQIKQDKKTKESYETKLSSRIDVIAQTRDENNSNWGIELRFKDSDNVEKS